MEEPQERQGKIPRSEGAKNVGGALKHHVDIVFDETTYKSCIAIRTAILNSVTVGADLSDSNRKFELPFPHLDMPFNRLTRLAKPKENDGAVIYVEYIGRSKFSHLRKKVLQMHPECRELDAELKVFEPAEAECYMQTLHMVGTLGSGKSHLLLALACDLYATFARSAEDGSKQNQRVVYIPRCCILFLKDISMVDGMKKALKLSYCDDMDLLVEIEEIETIAGLEFFFRRESRRGTLIYFLYDGYNTVDTEGRYVKQLEQFGLFHVNVYCGSPTTVNFRSWQKGSSNNHNSDMFGLFRGLDEEEFSGFKKHLPALTNFDDAIQQKVHEQKVKFATGCIPLWLKCWKAPCNDEALDMLKNMRELDEAHRTLFSNLTKDRTYYLNLYECFFSNRQVDQSTSIYDMRYMYVDPSSKKGYIACGLYMHIIAQLIHQYEKKNSYMFPWDYVIEIELNKKPEFRNSSMLGFMVEHRAISKILNQGLLVNNIKYKCEKVVYFWKGDECELRAEEGGVLYVPEEFNYKHVDMVFRFIKNKKYGGDYAMLPKVTDYAELHKVYEQQLEYYVFGIQVSVGDFKKHSVSEKMFFAPETFIVWKAPDRSVGVDHIAKYFVWILLSKYADIEPPIRSCGPRSISLKSGMKLVEHEHATVFIPIDKFIMPEWP